MIIVRTDWPDFESYLASLSKAARKNYKYAMKLYGDMYPYREVPFVRDEVAGYMKLWEKQTVRGQSIRWGYNVESLLKHKRRGRLKVFSCGIAMQYIVQRGGYWDAEPVMYDKQYDYLATYMWFQLICYAINTRLDPINLGGGDDDWVNNLKHWKEYKHQYKFRYVPEKAKEDPDSEPQYYIKKRKLRLRSDRPFDIARTFLRRLFVKS
jgi:hypothetical protein